MKLSMFKMTAMAAAVIAANAAVAGSSSIPVTVTADVEDACSVATTDVTFDFGTFSANQAATKSAQASVSVTCSDDSPYTFSLSDVADVSDFTVDVGASADAAAVTLNLLKTTTTTETVDGGTTTTQSDYLPIVIDPDGEPLPTVAPNTEMPEFDQDRLVNDQQNPFYTETTTDNPDTTTTTSTTAAVSLHDPQEGNGLAQTVTVRATLSDATDRTKGVKVAGAVADTSQVLFVRF